MRNDTSPGRGAASIRQLQATARRLADPVWLRAFGRHLWQHFRHDRCFESAGALSYTTLLALVPLMAVILGVLSAFPVFDRAVEQLQDFIFANFVPATGDVVRDYLDDFISRSTGLTAPGTMALIITALILMSTIEKTLNRIWRVEHARRPGNRLLVYWGVLTLGPLLLGASLGLTSVLAALPLLAPEFARGTLQSALLVATPFLVALLAFTLIFVFVPNRRVRWRHAVAGAALSALAFELSKRGFVLYIANFPTYEKLYGALATVPLFLVWIYVSWVVILLGASLAAALTTFSFRRIDQRWNPRHHLVLAVRLIAHLWRAQRRGRGLSIAGLLELEPAATDAELDGLLDALADGGLVHRDENDDWFLSADLEEVTLLDVYRRLPVVMPMGESERLPQPGGQPSRLGHALAALDERAAGILGQPVKSFVDRDGPVAAGAPDSEQPRSPNPSQGE